MREKSAADDSDLSDDEWPSDSDSSSSSDDEKPTGRGKGIHRDKIFDYLFI